MPTSFQPQLALREVASVVFFSAPGLHCCDRRPFAACVFAAGNRCHQGPILPVRDHDWLPDAILEPAKHGIGLVLLQIAQSVFRKAATKLLL
jgi:hypothetical protein